MLLLCVPCFVGVDLGDWSVYVVVLRSVCVGVRDGVAEAVYFDADSVGVKVVEVKDFEFLHEGCCVCSGGAVEDESDDLLLQCYQGLDVLFLFVCCSPYGDVADEVGVRMC